MRSDRPTLSGRRTLIPQAPFGGRGSRGHGRLDTPPGPPLRNPPRATPTPLKSAAALQGTTRNTPTTVLIAPAELREASRRPDRPAPARKTPLPPPPPRETPVPGRSSGIQRGSGVQRSAAQPAELPVRARSLRRPYRDLTALYPQWLRRASAIEPDQEQSEDTTVTSLRNGKLVLGAALALSACVALLLLVRNWSAERGEASLVVLTEPVDATVVLDDLELAGKHSPYSLKQIVPRANHVLEVRKAGYDTHVQALRLEPGELRVLPRIALRPRTGGVPTVAGSAGTCQDGVALAQPLATSQALSAVGSAPSAPHRGAAVPAVPLAVSSAGVMPVAAALAAAPSLNRERSSSGSGTLPAGVARPSRAARRAHEAAAPDDVPGANDASDAPPAQAAPNTGADASPEMGLLRLNSRPWTRIAVDGVPMGTTPQLALPLRAGKHHVKLTNPDLVLTRTFDVVVHAGKTTTRVVELLK